MFDTYSGSVDHPDWKELFYLAGIGVFIGVLSGLCAVVFRLMIAFFHNLFFSGTFSLVYDSLEHTPLAPWGVGIIVVPVMGALLVAFLVRNFSPRARSHGVPEIINAIYYGDSKLNPFLALIKSLTSAISIGSGGSIGREGPIVQITASLGSGAAGWLKLPGRVRTVILAAAAAGGIAGSFNSPIGGVLFTVELFLPAVSAAALLPVTLSAATATLVMQAIFGCRRDLPIGMISGLYEASFSALTLLVLLGICSGLFSSLFIVGLCRIENTFRVKVENYYIRHAFGMLLVGVGFYFFGRFYGQYDIEGLGYSSVFDLLTGRNASVGFLFLLLGGKLCATWLTLGSGGSGGVFCPSLLFGALTGALVAPLAHWLLPGAEIPHGLFVLAGMAASVGGITGAVFSGIVMVAELTGNYEILTAASVASVVAFAVRRTLVGGGIYSQKLEQSNIKVPEGLQSATLSSLKVSDLSVPLPPGKIPEHFVPVDAATDLDTALRLWQEQRADGLLVMDGKNPVGVIADADLGRICRESAGRML